MSNDNDELGPEYSPPETMGKEDLIQTAELLAGLEEYIGTHLRGFVLRAIRGHVSIQGQVENRELANEICNWLKNQKNVFDVENNLTIGANQ